MPHPLVGLVMEACITDALVEVLHRGQRVACHARSERRGGFTTLDKHLPAAHRVHKEWTPERLIHWGAGIGPDTGRFVTQLMQRLRHPGHGYRNCLGLLNLAKRYGAPRVEAACMLALELGAGHYRKGHEGAPRGPLARHPGQPARPGGPGQRRRPIGSARHTTTCAARRTTTGHVP